MAVRSQGSCGSLILIMCMGIPTCIHLCLCVYACMYMYMHPCISMQMAEEVLKSGPVDGERRGAGEEGEGRAAFEGMEALAKAIETGKRERERERERGGGGGGEGGGEGERESFG